ncbi:MAG: MFS transporter [Dehalococcoidales bacterium]|nr:MFS transporter [Dehalococcoidales bacterium]
MNNDIKITHREKRNTLLKQNLKNCNRDAWSQSVMRGLTENYITPLALAFRATDFQIGVLAGLPSLVEIVSQFIGPRLAEKTGGRKRFVRLAAFLHALSWLLVALLPLFFINSGAAWLIAFIILGSAFPALSSPAWGSLASDIVPARIRGRFFGRQGAISGIILIGTSVAASLILKPFENSDTLSGFVILFGMAVLARLVSWAFISGINDPVTNSELSTPLKILDLVRGIWRSNLGRFVLINGLIDFTISFSSPFFSVYLLDDLGYDIVLYNILIQTARIATFLFMVFWGRLADRRGNMKVFKITYLMIAIVPLAWAVSPGWQWLIAVQLLSGFAWAGFNLSSVNFIYDAAPREEMSRYVALHAAFCGAGTLVGSTLGGVTAPYFPLINGSSHIGLFLTSGALHVLLLLTILTALKEVRSIKNY